MADDPSPTVIEALRRHIAHAADNPLLVAGANQAIQFLVTYFSALTTRDNASPALQHQQRELIGTIFNDVQEARHDYAFLQRGGLTAR